MSITKKNEIYRYREQTSGYSGEGGRGTMGMGEWEVKTIGCKIGSRLYCTTRNIANVL